VIQIIVILLVAYVIVPLLDLSIAERARYPAKIIVYIVTLLWVIYTLFVGVRP
jgi:hypothetical protein